MNPTVTQLILARDAVWFQLQEHWLLALGALFLGAALWILCLVLVTKVFINGLALCFAPFKRKPLPEVTESDPPPRKDFLGESRTRLEQADAMLKTFRLLDKHGYSVVKSKFHK